MTGHLSIFSIQWLCMEQKLDFKIDRIRLFGESRLRTLCDQLISWSQWFSVMPLPDDEWEIEVRIENAARVRSLAHAFPE